MIYFSLIGKHNQDVEFLKKTWVFAIFAQTSAEKIHKDMFHRIL